MIALLPLLLLASGPEVRAPAPALGTGFAYRETSGPKRKRVRVKRRETYAPAVLVWTRVQGRCDRAVGNCVMGPPDLLKRELDAPAGGQERPLP